MRDISGKTFIEGEVDLVFVFYGGSSVNMEIAMVVGRTAHSLRILSTDCFNGEDASPNRKPSLKASYYLLKVSLQDVEDYIENNFGGIEGEDEQETTWKISRMNRFQSFVEYYKELLEQR